MRHELVHRLKRDFPALTIVVNGGIASPGQVAGQLVHVDGVMVGRSAYHDPWSMASWDVDFLGATEPAATSREAVEHGMVAYMERLARQGTGWHVAARHMMGLWNGTPGARRWRQVWSDHRLKALPAREVAAMAALARRGETRSAEQIATGVAGGAGLATMGG